ncbi:MAG: hypothetical protein ACOVOL_08250, partial [Bacteroidia bacterium]
MKKIITTTFLFLSVFAQAQKKDKKEAVCPMGHGSTSSASAEKTAPGDAKPSGNRGTTNEDWWPNQLNLS